MMRPSQPYARRAIKALAILLVCNAGLGSAADVQIRVVRHSKNIAAPRGTAFVNNLIALLRSCTVHSTAYAVKAETWQETLRTDSWVHAVFGAPTRIRVKGGNTQTWEETVIQEILLPLPEGNWPGHIFAKSGAVVLSFTKYDPRALERVVAEPALQISSVQPYESLSRLKDKKR